MTDTKDGFIVRLLKLAPNASGQQGVPNVIRAHIPLHIDFDAPRAQLVESSRRVQPTVFATEKEAEEKMSALMDRLRAIRRNTERTGRHPNVGACFELLGKTVADKQIGGFEIAPLQSWLNEVQEERAIETQIAREELAQKEAQAKLMQAQVAQLAEEIEETKTGSEWRANSTPGVQHRVKKDGQTVFRARRNGATSPSFDTIEEAQAFLANQDALQARVLARS